MWHTKVIIGDNTERQKLGNKKNFIGTLGQAAATVSKTSLNMPTQYRIKRDEVYWRNKEQWEATERSGAK